MGVKVEIPYKDLVMVQDQYTYDYEGHCPWCDNIFYIPIEHNEKTHPFYHCRFCHGLVRVNN